MAQTPRDGVTWPSGAWKPMGWAKYRGHDVLIWHRTPQGWVVAFADKPIHAAFAVGRRDLTDVLLDVEGPE